MEKIVLMSKENLCSFLSGGLTPTTNSSPMVKPLRFYFQYHSCVYVKVRKSGTIKTYCNPKLKALARQLRNNSTKSEIKLWLCLKGKQMCGYDFHRQKPIDEYIVDVFSSGEAAGDVSRR